MVRGVCTDLNYYLIVLLLHCTGTKMKLKIQKWSSIPPLLPFPHHDTGISFFRILLLLFLLLAHLQMFPVSRSRFLRRLKADLTGSWLYLKNSQVRPKNRLQFSPSSLASHTILMCYALYKQDRVKFEFCWNVCNNKKNNNNFKHIW